MEESKLLYWIERFLKSCLVVSLVIAMLFAFVIANAESYQGMVDDVERTKEQQGEDQAIDAGKDKFNAYQKTVDNVGAKIEAQKPEYQKIVDANKKEFVNHEREIKEIVKEAEAAFKKHSENIKIEKGKEGGLIDQIVQNAKNLDIQKKSDKSQGIIVFISFSMPKGLLLSYHKQVQLYGGRLVIRGLIDNSFKKTIKAMDVGNNQTLIVDINPNLFKDYGVTRVPTILINHKEKTDKFVGSIGLKYALEESSTKGDSKELATSILKKNQLNNQKGDNL